MVFVLFNGYGCIIISSNPSKCGRRPLIKSIQKYPPLSRSSSSKTSTYTAWPSNKYHSSHSGCQPLQTQLLHCQSGPQIALSQRTQLRQNNILATFWAKGASTKHAKAPMWIQIGGNKRRRGAKRGGEQPHRVREGSFSDWNRVKGGLWRVFPGTLPNLILILPLIYINNLI